MRPGNPCVLLEGSLALAFVTFSLACASVPSQVPSRSAPTDSVAIEIAAVKHLFPNAPGGRVLMYRGFARFPEHSRIPRIAPAKRGANARDCKRDQRRHPGRFHRSGQALRNTAHVVLSRPHILGDSAVVTITTYERATTARGRVFFASRLFTLRRVGQGRVVSTRILEIS